MQKELNHKVRKCFNEGIYNVARYTEIVLSIIILIVIALAGIRLIFTITEIPIMKPSQTLIGVIAIAILFAIRKFLMTEDDDMAHAPVKKHADMNKDENVDEKE